MGEIKKIPSGIPGLDKILKGGLTEGGIFIVQGGPGSGKTTFGLQFLKEGIKQGEKVLYISLEETRAQVEKYFGRLWDDRIEFLDISPGSGIFIENKVYDIFTPADVERDPISKMIHEALARIRPRRVLIDSLTQFKYLTNSPYQCLRYMLSFFNFLRSLGITVLLTAEPEEPQGFVDLRYNVDGVFFLNKEHRVSRFFVDKFRGSDFLQGRHDYTIEEEGVLIFPALSTGGLEKKKVQDDFSSGNAEIDRMLKGGLPLGSTTLISGPSGVGKSTLAAQFARELAGRNQAILYLGFDESEDSFLRRGRSVNIDLTPYLNSSRKLFFFREVEPDYYSPLALANEILKTIEQAGISVVVFDTITTYFTIFQDEPGLLFQFVSLIKVLKRLGITVFIINEDEKIVSQEFQLTKFHISPIVDNAIFLRYIEYQSSIIRTIGIIKKRTGDFEKTLREFEITEKGLRVGEPLKNLVGILVGLPVLEKKK